MILRCGKKTYPLSDIYKFKIDDAGRCRRRHHELCSIKHNYLIVGRGKWEWQYAFVGFEPGAEHRVVSLQRTGPPDPQVAADTRPRYGWAGGRPTYLQLPQSYPGTAEFCS